MLLFILLNMPKNANDNTVLQTWKKSFGANKVIPEELLPRNLSQYCMQCVLKKLDEAGEMKDERSGKPTTNEHYLKVIHLITDANILILIALSA